MSEIKLVRVDDRLVHGQTVVAWVRHVPVDTLLVVDDVTAANPMLQKLLKLAAPGYSVVTASIEDAIAGLKGGELTGKTMVIVRSPVCAVPLFQAGIDGWPRELNVGALGGKPNAKQVNTTTYLLPEEIEAVDWLAQQGVAVYFQMVPGTHRQDWDQLRSRFI